MAKKTADQVRVMLVDDHSVVREGLKNYLGALGRFHVVGEASSGAEALELAATTRPQVVLMDLVMPRWTESRRRAASTKRIRRSR